MTAPKNPLPVLAPLAAKTAALGQWTKSGSLALLLVLLLSSTAAAKKHPVPLDPKTDAAQCAECHADKAKGKVVHSAIASGCLTCHEVRVNKDATYVKLTTSTSGKLCLSCHSDKDAATLKGRVHPPAVRDCTTCHDPHTTDNKNQLLQPTSGAAKNENLCLKCHDIGMNVPQKGSRHAALDMGCDTCHVTHKTGDITKREFRKHLAKATPALCLDCHDASDANLQKVHNNQPFQTADCITCHDPHSSNGPKLIQKFAHNPFENKMCDSCHQPAKDGKVVLAQSDSRALCLTCHDDKGKEIETAKVQHPGAQGECVACHNPHAGKSPRFLQPDPVSACTTCHTDVGELHSKKTLHQPVFEQGCSICHEPHGGNNQKLLRAKGEALCLECHGPKREPKELKEAHAITIFDGKVMLPEDYFSKNRVTVLPIKGGKGHPTPNHPMQDIRDLSDLTKVKREINCMTCHQPHASGGKALLVKDQNPGLQFCQTCHKGAIGMGE